MKCLKLCKRTTLVAGDVFENAGRFYPTQFIGAKIGIHKVTENIDYYRPILPKQKRKGGVKSIKAWVHESVFGLGKTPDIANGSIFSGKVNKHYLAVTITLRKPSQRKEEK